MTVFRSLPLIGIVAAILGACSGVSDPVTAVELDVPEQTYDRVGTPPKATVLFRVVNRGSETAFIHECGVEFHRWNGESWAYYSSDICTADLRPPTALAPGASLAFTRTMGEPGRYRLRMLAEPVASEDGSIVSRDFEVR